MGGRCSERGALSDLRMAWGNAGGDGPRLEFVETMGRIFFQNLSPAVAVDVSTPRWDQAVQRLRLLWLGRWPGFPIPSHSKCGTGFLAVQILHPRHHILHASSEMQLTGPSANQGRKHPALIGRGWRCACTRERRAVCLRTKWRSRPTGSCRWCKARQRRPEERRPLHMTRHSPNQWQWRCDSAPICRSPGGQRTCCETLRI